METRKYETLIIRIPKTNQNTKTIPIESEIMKYKKYAGAVGPDIGNQKIDSKNENANAIYAETTNPIESKIIIYKICKYCQLV